MDRIDELVHRMTTAADPAQDNAALDRFIQATHRLDTSPEERQRIHDLADLIDTQDAAYGQGLSALEHGDKAFAESLLMSAGAAGIEEAAALVTALQDLPSDAVPHVLRQRAADLTSQRLILNATNLGATAHMNTSTSRPPAQPSTLKAETTSGRRLPRLLGRRRVKNVTLAQVSALLLDVIEVRDPFTRTHGERVADLAALVAGELDMPRTRVEEIRFAAMFHDIGKLNIPTSILRKARALTEDEFTCIKLHTARGPEIVQAITEVFDAPIEKDTQRIINASVQGILHHHERYDGTGYPRGLAGQQIPEYARVIAVADIFDAMTTSRSYRPALPVDQALERICYEAGKCLDPDMVEALVIVIERYGWSPPEPRPPAPAGVVEPTWQSHDDPSHPLRVAGRT
ncbi:HD-GYP domain-containing protein [Actinoallomurus rhizosphaericola]|uniref:HD-GYP domain-containing protein n=1 Tax=Actinoallomurus rhizosphaericola TaxID=2952536 RepID=UPI002092AB7D|nr:HD-GYP domain-containing protein [Actinoallomurus rhizosphaericola]MCO5998431.1 HD-GYP domain-containing protein [Actinoallomurus rhizosphaericola]